MDTAVKPIVTTTSLSFLLHGLAVAGLLLVSQQSMREEGVGRGVEIQLISSVLVSDEQEADVPRKQELVQQASSAGLMHTAEKKFAQDILTSLGQVPTAVAKEPGEQVLPERKITEQQHAIKQVQPAVYESVGLAAAAYSTNASYQQHTILELLHRRISDDKEYPYLARRQRREGVATVAFVLHPDGTIENPRLVTSSRAGSLDHAALSAVKQIAPFEAAQQYLEKSETFQVDIEFDLL